ncbi:heptaprenyl diphosphate synthase component II [Anoxybacillus sp. LAT_35]|uniref:heptaprenyl diphosphate synthase component II n=1 Tax=Anoxybacillus TaxID=150247 RepID=UPI001EDB9EB1|nr:MULTISPECIES: heptaprenyl diphosphate synthase component II [Anoxybacillus]MCG5024496.1 heptaprenyl diphosphate synthase component II [Anoxybacillus flavithermus]MCG6198512.1 heptaprenyl diphosphate synthase component II [Anoxybacillus sp. LAT_38]MCG3083437.1 heptaprenyl diphosphate synthase component II [Anoxybacillus sp. LAT27]MCG6172125.1 heptaprenyl diphosphate synthase component II [Anoxybacillus sp. LAT_11]MCG6174458.1 heptaprenyl diphosphate synthase component II [Anoxybacillus sp. L
MKLKAMYSFLNGDLNKIEEQLKLTVQASDPLVNEASLHLLEAGGKRIRPVFVLLGGQFGTYHFEKMKRVAVALELIHMASLVHDDVIDGAMLRRGKETIQAKWGDRFAMYVGDYLFARALEQMCEIDDPVAHRILANTIVEVCRGEIEQISDKYRFDQNLRRYLQRIKRKTALLIAASCQLGAVVAGAPEAVHKTLYWFGYYVGMSFQITDDILDFIGTEKQLGKPAGSDLSQGNVTLPVLYAMKERTVKEQIMKVNEHTTNREMADVIDGIKRTNAIEKSYELGDRYLQKALDTLQKLPRNRAWTALYNIAKYIGKRKY